ncbi:hypothetical protein A3860_00300 [Niastella vici]|uniref:Uncharacterized protein n=1 Tax=Niastella vici TaxID=1703345 RepID=A0A1V9G8P9_9BACT|nr:hypothetical protein A3860_00300 [Niastella vici]
MDKEQNFFFSYARCLIGNCKVKAKVNFRSCKKVYKSVKKVEKCSNGGGNDQPMGNERPDLYASGPLHLH